MPNKPEELLRQALEALEACDAEIFSEPLATRTTVLVTSIRAHLAGAEPPNKPTLTDERIKDICLEIYLTDYPKQAGYDIAVARAIERELAGAEPKFAATFCSQCGRQFGPGDSGYSHCSDHQPPAPMTDEQFADMVADASIAADLAANPFKLLNFAREILKANAALAALVPPPDGADKGKGAAAIAYRALVAADEVLQTLCPDDDVESEKLSALLAQVQEATQALYLYCGLGTAAWPEVSASEGWPCEIAEADFSQDTVTLHMTAPGYIVGAGPHMLVPLAAAQQTQEKQIK